MSFFFNCVIIVQCVANGPIRTDKKQSFGEKVTAVERILDAGKKA